MAKFRAKIEAIKQAESERGETVHLTNVNVEELAWEDKIIWEKVENESITREDFQSYRPSLGSNLSRSRKEFSFFVANKLNPIWLRKEMRERGEAEEE